MSLTPQIPAHPSGDKWFKLLDVAIKRHQFGQDALIGILHTAQELFGYLDTDVPIYVGRSLRAPMSSVYRVATSYNFFSMKPPRDHTCVVCMGTACYVKGAGQILQALEQKHGIKAGETTEDGKVSLVTARSLGACGGRAPRAVVLSIVGERFGVRAELTPAVRRALRGPFGPWSVTRRPGSRRARRRFGPSRSQHRGDRGSRSRRSARRWRRSPC